MADPTHAPPKNSDRPSNNPDTISGDEKASANPADSEPEAKQSTHIQPDQSRGAAAIMSIFLTPSNQASGKADDPILVAPVSPWSDPAVHVGHSVVTSVDPGVHTALPSQGVVVTEGAPLQHGPHSVISAQTISAQSGAISPQQQDSALEPPPVPTVTFTVAGEEHTAVQQANGAIDVDGESYGPGAVIDIDGSRITVAAPGISVGGTMIPFEESPAQNKEGAVFTIDGQRYSVESQLGSLRINGAPVSVGSKTTINSES